MSQKHLYLGVITFSQNYCVVNERQMDNGFIKLLQCSVFPVVVLWEPGIRTITNSLLIYFLFIYLLGVLRRFQHCTGHITTGSWKGRGNQYIQFVRVLYCKLPTNGKQLPAFPLEAVPGIEPRPQRWEARVLPLCHRGLLL